MREEEFWITTKPQWEMLCSEYLEKLKFLDLEFATIRQMLYTTNKGSEGPSRRLNQFLMFEPEDERTPEEVSNEIMQQMMGLMNL